MDFQDRFALTQVLYSLFSLLELSSPTRMMDLLSEDMTIQKGIRVVGISPVSKFPVGPFESTDDRFYNFTNHQNWKKEREWNNGFGNKKQTEISPDDGKSELQNRNQVNTNSDLFYKENDQPQEVSRVLEQINNIKIQIKKLQLFSKILESEISNIEKSLPIISFENIVKKVLKGDKTLNKNGGDEMNNIINNNRYLIGNTFIINKLSEKNLKRKETEVEILKELTDRKMKELLEKALNNLNKNGIRIGDDFVITHPSPDEMDLLNQLQRNFFRMFNREKVTLENVNQMSRIIDFVERYHGTVSELGLSVLHE